MIKDTNWYLLIWYISEYWINIQFSKYIDEKYRINKKITDTFCCSCWTPFRHRYRKKYIFLFIVLIKEKNRIDQVDERGIVLQHRVSIDKNLYFLFAAGQKISFGTTLFTHKSRKSQRHTDNNKQPYLIDWILYYSLAEKWLPWIMPSPWAMRFI